MTEQKVNEHKHIVRRVLIEILLPAVGFGIGVGFATGDYMVSLITGLAISSTIYVLYQLDRAFLHPHLERLSCDWGHLGLEMTLLLLEHVLGALLALLVCSGILGFAVVPSAAWVALGGMVIVFPIIHGTGLALGYYRQLKEKERVEQELRALATEAELKALKAQINPHFLFNTLNTIAFLIHTNPDRAEGTVERLAEMFRYVLNGSERRLVSLEAELAFVDGYLEIERARFGDRLHVTHEIDAEALDVSVPGLILQPSVENVVRHGQGRDGSIDLAINVRLCGDQAIVAITDRGPGMPSGYRADIGQSVGLRNVNERLRKTYGLEHKLEIQPNQPHGTIVTIKIPLKGQE